MVKDGKFKRIYSDSVKKDKLVDYGKYADKTLSWLVKNDPEFFKKVKVLYYKKYNIHKKNFYDDLFKRHFANKEKYQDIKQDLVEIFINDKKNSILVSESKEKLRSKYKDISEVLLNECALEAKNTIRREFEIERDFLVDIHVLRYEELYLKALEPDLSRVPPAYHNSVLAESYYNAIEILSQKEKVLGIHSKTFKIQINNFIQQRKQKAVQSINFDVLSLHEQCELLQIIESTKASDIDEDFVVQSNTEEEVVKVPEVLKIEAPIRQSKQTDVVGEEEKKVGKQSGKSLFEVQDKIRESLKKQVEEAIKKSKGNKK